MHSKPKINKIKIGNITTDGQPCAAPDNIIRYNPAAALRLKKIKLCPVVEKLPIMHTYRP